jgi:hypothetical protein
MYSLDNAFNELLDKIRDPDAVNPAKSDPVFYFAYPPELMLDLKKHLQRLTTKIREAGFEVRRVSLADILGIQSISPADGIFGLNWRQTPIQTRSMKPSATSSARGTPWSTGWRK